MDYKESDDLTNIHGRGRHTDVVLSETLIAQIIKAVQASGCYRGVPCAPGLGGGLVEAEREVRSDTPSNFL